MRSPGWSRAHLRLAAVFLGLVLLPSFLLGYFSLRAVETERRARQGRIFENYERYSEFAARAVHQELVEVESVWLDLAPGRVGWEERVPAIIARLDSPSLAERYVHTAWLLRSDGAILHPAGIEASRVRSYSIPTAAEARIFQDLVAIGESAEFDRGDVDEVISTDNEILRRVHNPRLRAIASVDLARACLRSNRWDEAIVAARRVLTQYPDALDLDNQPLGFLARLYLARALEGKLQPVPAVTALRELETDLVEHSDEISGSQFGFFIERLDAALTRLEPQLDAAARLELAQRRTPRVKKPVGDAFYVHKLSRKLVRAMMDESPYSSRLRYISDVVDGEPYLLVYHFLPDRNERGITGLAGYRVDLPRLSTAVLPGFLQELALSEDAWLEIVDENGHRVIGDQPPAPEPSIAISNLREPFEFWNVAVHSSMPAGAIRAVDFRTKVFLYGILLLLLTIAAGAVLVARGMRHEARLTNQKTTFVSNVSHELRTPLTAIRMYAEMLEMAGGRMNEAERRRQLGVIRGECGRLERLIDSVLDLASLQRGTKRFELEYEEIDAVVRSAAEEFREQAESQGFQYQVEIEPDLPEVRLDADAMRQVLLNLLSNAVKYSDDERWIAVRAARRGDEVAIQVEDRGIGIEPREHQKIFEDFYRVDQRLSTPRPGVGLGLTLVRRIVEAHHGRITVESAPGRGARFTIWLPVEPTEAGGTAPPGGRIPQEA